MVCLSHMSCVPAHCHISRSSTLYSISTYISFFLCIGRYACPCSYLHKSALPSRITSGVAILPCDDWVFAILLARCTFYILSKRGLCIIILTCLFRGAIIDFLLVRVSSPQLRGSSSAIMSRICLPGTYADFPAKIFIDSTKPNSTLSTQFSCAHNINVPHDVTSIRGVAHVTCSGPVVVPTEGRWFHSQLSFQIVYSSQADMPLWSSRSKTQTTWHPR